MADKNPCVVRNLVDGERRTIYDTYATIRMESQLNRERCNFSGIKDLAHPQMERISRTLKDRVRVNRRNLRMDYHGLRSASRLLRRFAPRNDVYTRGACGPAPVGAAGGAIVQNKANFDGAKWILTAWQEKGYEKRTRIMPLRKQSQFQGRDCFVASLLAMT